MRSLSLSLLARLIFVITLIIVASMWRLTLHSSNSQPTLIGYYGEAPLIIRCPDSGHQHLNDIHLGAVIEADKVIASYESDEHLLLKRQFHQEFDIAKSELLTKIAALKLNTTLMAAQRKQSIQTSLSDLWATREQRAKAEAKIKSLTQSLPKVQKSVRSGTVALRDFALLKADLESTKATVSPLKNQEFAQLKSSTILSSDQHDTLNETVEQAMKSELENWEKAALKIENLLQDLSHIKSPFRSLVTALPNRHTQRCSTGDVIIKLQPLVPKLRLWQINHLDLTRSTSSLLVAHLISYQGQLSSKSIEAQVTRQAYSLTSLPIDLQGVAHQVLGVNTLFTKPTPVYGIPIEAKFDPNAGNDIPWGHLVVVK
jgi:hypothetical protein